MSHYRVHLQTLTEQVVTVEASSPERAAELAEEAVYDEVHEADRAGWRATHVEEVP